MITHVWSVLCMASLTDKDTNLVSLINVIDEVGVREEQLGPDSVLPIGLELVSLWIRTRLNEPATGLGRITQFAPSGTEVSRAEIALDLTNYERLRTRRVIRGVRVPEPGQYSFLVEMQSGGETKWTEVARVPLTFKLGASNDGEQESAEDDEQSS